MRLRPLTRTDLLVAALLAVGYFALLLATSDGIGYTRDESFYFDAAQVYQRWFVNVERASSEAEREAALGKRATVDAWRTNFEHPPLPKVLFGYSWRLFGQKVREAEWSDSPRGVAITGLQTPEGFERGAVVEVQGVTPLHADGTPGSPRRIALGTVVSRTPGKAVLALQPGGPKDRGEWSALCRAAPERVARGCSAVERRALAVVGEITAFRLPAFLLSGLLLALVYLFGAQTLSRVAGLFGAVTFGLVPRHFFHAHLICFDLPITTLVMATLYAYVLSERSRRWAVAAAVVWGLALLTKLNAFFTPGAIALYWLVSRWREVRRSRDGGPGLQLPPVPLALLLMPPIGLAMLFALWPKLWYDPFKSFSEYVGFHMNHVNYLQEYFGRILGQPPYPLGYPFVKTFFTVPALLMLAFLPGLVLFLRRSSGLERPLKVFYVVNLLVPIGIIAVPTTPVFGGIKHWLPSMPFFCLLAGYGFDRFVRAAARELGDRRFARPALALLLGGLTVASLTVQTADAYPHLTAYWNEWMGGFQGAANQRMQRQFWGHGTEEVMPFVNRSTPPRGRVDFHETTCGTAAMYKREGWLRDDVGCSNAAFGTASALYEDQKSCTEVELDIRETYDRLLPSFTVDRHGVPLIQVYQPRASAPVTPRAPVRLDDGDGDGAVRATGDDPAAPILPLSPARRLSPPPSAPPAPRASDPAGSRASAAPGGSAPPAPSR